MARGFHLGRIAGIDVYLDWSLAIIFTLVTVSLGAGGFPAWHPDWGMLTIWATAIAAAVLFLASVLTHEMSHALVGRMHGIEVPQITLFVFGGMAQMREEPHSWRPELWMAIAGPVTSLVLGGAFIALGMLLSAPPPLEGEDPQEFFAALGPVATLLFWLGPINVILGLFNLVPGFPLDGGRVLRAVLWGATGDLVRATRWASNAGRAFAWLLIGTGFAMALGVTVPIFGTGLAGGLWLALIGWFLNNAAVMSYRQLMLRESLADVPVSRLMQRAVRTVGPGVSVQSLVDDYVLRAEQRAFPVVEHDRMLGLVCLRDVYKLPRDEWAATTVERIMTPADAVAHVAPGDSGADAMNELSRRQVNQLPVVEGGRVAGMLRREDVLRWLSLYGDSRFRNARA
ncbi:MAG: site-2 protease family protein [Gammaproteobacteria bacterium]|nr:site-2 protease family protein [Gammaproteobacteria bacterium]